MFASYKLFWKNYFNYKGTASKKDFWWPFLLNLILWIVLVVALFIVSKQTDSAATRKVLAGIYVASLVILGLGPCHAACAGSGTGAIPGIICS